MRKASARRSSAAFQTSTSVSTTDSRSWEELLSTWPPGQGWAVLVVGLGRIGSRVARHLTKAGIHLFLIDNGVVERKNVPDQEYSLSDARRNLNKATALAQRIRQESGVEVRSLDADFLMLSREQQLQLIRRVDLVVAATDNELCQHRINQLSLSAEVDAVYPGIWDRPGIRPGEVGEVNWVLPGRHTTCLVCNERGRDPVAAVAPRRAARWNDCTPLVDASAHTVLALLNFESPESSWLIPERHRHRRPPPNRFFVHGVGPVSDSLIDGRLAFFDPEHPLGIRWELTEYLTNCPACGGAPRARRATTAAAPATRPVVQQPTRPVARTGTEWQRPAAVVGTLVVVIVIVALLINSSRGGGGTEDSTSTANTALTPITDAPFTAAPPVAPAPTAAPAETTIATVPTTPPPEPQPAGPPPGTPNAIATSAHASGKYRSEIYGVDVGGSAISVRFGAYGLHDLARPERSCLIVYPYASRTEPSGFNLTLDEPGRYMGTISFPREYWDPGREVRGEYKFFYGCNLDYDGVVVYQVPF